MGNQQVCLPLLGRWLLVSFPFSLSPPATGVGSFSPSYCGSYPNLHVKGLPWWAHFPSAFLVSSCLFLVARGSLISTQVRPCQSFHFLGFPSHILSLAQHISSLPKAFLLLALHGHVLESRVGSFISHCMAQSPLWPLLLSPSTLRRPRAWWVHPASCSEVKRELGLAQL